MRFAAFVASAAAALALAAPAYAGFIVESEGNNTLGTADDFGAVASPGDTLVGLGTITAADVDWYRLELLDPTFFIGITLGTFDVDDDSQIQLVNAQGVVIAFDDDSGPDLSSQLGVFNLDAGVYFVGVSQFDDIGEDQSGLEGLFDGINPEGDRTTETFSYLLSIGINTVPAPSAAGALALAGLVAARRRRA